MSGEPSDARRGSPVRVICLIAVLIASVSVAFAQFPRGVPGGFGVLRGEANGAGWRSDCPWGQRNLLIRLSELTKTRVSR